MLESEQPTGTEPAPRLLETLRLLLLRQLPRDRRYRRAVLATAVSVSSSGLQFLVQLVITPVLLAYLGTTRFGAWMTLYSFVSMLVFLDFGIGLGLLNALAQCYGRDDVAGAKRHVSSAFAVLGGIALLLGIVATAAYPYISWGDIFNVHDQSLVREITQGGAILLLCIVLTVPVSVGARVLTAYQLAYMANIWDVFAKLLIFAGVFLVIHFNGGIPGVVGAVVGSPVITGIGCSLFALLYVMPGLRPTLSCVDRDAAAFIARKGVLFLVLQLVAAFAFASDNIIITRALGADQVAGYAVARTLFQFLVMPISLLLMPLWPAYGEALARKDYPWVRKTLRRTILFSIAASIMGGLLLVLLGPTLLHYWVHDRVHASYTLLAGFGLFTVFSICGSCCSMLLNAASVMRFQIVVSVTMALFTVTTKVILAPRFGVEGVIWGTAIAYGFTSFLPMMLYTYRWLTKLPNQQEPTPMAT